MSTKKRKSTRSSTTKMESKLDDIMMNYINEIIKICFDEYSYKFSYRIESTSNKSMILHINIDNIHLNESASLSGNFIKDENFNSTITYVESQMGYRVGTFLVYIFMYISLLINVDEIKLENETDNPLRSTKGIYDMFEPINIYDEREIYNYLKSYFNDYDNLEEIHGSNAETIKHNLSHNFFFLKMKEEYENFDDIPEDLKNDIMTEEILRRNEGQMIYNVKSNSLPKIKNKIYELVKYANSINASDNPWNLNAYKNLKKKEMLGGKKRRHAKYKTMKYKTMKYKKTK
jgi:hypothetical protein